MSSRSDASRKAWATRKRMATVRSKADPQAYLEERMAGARELQGSARVRDDLSTIMDRIRASETAPPPSQGS